MSTYCADHGWESDEARITCLDAAEDRALAEIADLRAQLAASEQRAVKAEKMARIMEISVDRNFWSNVAEDSVASLKMRRLLARIDADRNEIADLRAQLAASERERDEVRDRVAHLEFDVDCARLDVATAEALVAPEFTTWLASLPIEDRAQICSYALQLMNADRALEVSEQARKEAEQRVAEAIADEHEAGYKRGVAETAGRLARAVAALREIGRLGDDGSYEWPGDWPRRAIELIEQANDIARAALAEIAPEVIEQPEAARTEEES